MTNNKTNDECNENESFEIINAREEEKQENPFVLSEPSFQIKPLKKIIRILVGFLSAAIAVGLLALVLSALALFNFGFTQGLYVKIAYIAVGILFGIIGYAIAPNMVRRFMVLVRTLENWLNSIPFEELLVGLIGLAVGLLLALLLSYLVSAFPMPQGIKAGITTGLYVLLGLVGVSVAISRRKRGDLKLSQLTSEGKKGSRTTRESRKAKKNMAKPKILDTSVIIDGRIFDICKTGVIEGELVIPGFVLQELRHVSDSADSLKRNRGRRGLDILSRLQKELDIPVVVNEKDYEDIAEVDAKLLKLSQDIDGVVLTNDFNLNKVAAVQNVPVLNINDLANAIKPVVLPGEEMSVMIVKEGKEPGQGVGYLDDGTMIVVEGGRKYVGKTLNVIVTSVLQTSAGRMIFVKAK